MRPSICLLVLGAGLTAASVLPAAANTITSRSPNVAVNGHVPSPSLQHGVFRRLPLLGPFAFGGPVVFPGGFFDGDFTPVAAGTPVVMLSGPPAPPPRPRHSAGPSIETAVAGMVIVRGPGSRRLGH